MTGPASLEELNARPRIPFYPADTLLNMPRAESAEGLDIALFGVPFDGHTLRRPGSRYAPAHIRANSYNIRSTNVLTGITPRLLCSISDIGDAPIDVLDPFKSFDMISEYCRTTVATGARPLAVGGDNGISLAVLRGVASRHGPVAVVHVDAHPDTMDQVAGSRYNAATPYRRATEEGLEDPSRHIIIGLRGTMPPDTEAVDWARSVGMTLLDIDQCCELGPAAIAKKIKQIVGDAPAYISMDVDGLDPADMPGTTSPEPGGLRMREAQILLRGLRGLDIVGADINEVSPPLDPTGITSFNAAHLLFEILCLTAESVDLGRRRS